VTTAFTLLTICQGGEILLQTARILIYMKLFNKKMKDVLFRLFMLETLLGPHLRMRGGLNCQLRQVKKSSRTTRVEYISSRLPRHDEDRMLLANMDGFTEFQFGVRSQSDVLEQASWAIQRIITNEEHM